MLEESYLSDDAKSSNMFDSAPGLVYRACAKADPPPAGLMKPEVIDSDCLPESFALWLPGYLAASGESK